MIGFCFLSVVPLRREASDCSEMVSQVLRDETFAVLERGEKWSRVRLDYDGYDGWIDNKQYRILNEKTARTLPTGRFWGAEEKSPSQVAMTYLDVPYLWGGRSRGGIDCSGLTQACFGACGIWLPRDARDQALLGEEVAAVSSCRADDLCFFGTDREHVTHVGIAMGGGSIIHASGYVRIDALDDHGILVAETGEYSHRLVAIRRITRV